jgi:hypothetical protein
MEMGRESAGGADSVRGVTEEGWKVEGCETRRRRRLPSKARRLLFVGLVGGLMGCGLKGWAAVVCCTGLSTDDRPG